MRATPDLIAQALRNCENEPVRTPESIQPGGALLAYDNDTHAIAYVSDNVGDYLIWDHSAAELLGVDIQTILSSDVIHALNNSLTGALSTGRRSFVATLEGATTQVDIHVFGSEGYTVLELEPSDPTGGLNAQTLQTVLQMMNRIDADTSEASLLEDAVQLVRSLTGYDRVIAYRFDQSFNGECIAESRAETMESYLGLRFPASDIPAQARAVMVDLPLRYILSSDAAPVGLLARTASLGPLDITQANLRGVSPVHLEYLRNMGLGGTLTLSLVLGDRLWGMISCHSTLPKSPSNQVRTLCAAILPLLQTKLELAIQTRALNVSRDIDELRRSLDMGQPSLQDRFDAGAPRIAAGLQASGLTLRVAGHDLTFGDVASEAHCDALRAKADIAESGIFATESLEEFTPSTSQFGGAIAGAVALRLAPDASCILFRPPIATTIAWAGPPNKDITVSQGQVQLHPRASFARYLEAVRDMSEPWTATDLQAARALGDALANAVRATAGATSDISRYKLMLQEMDHRFKNVFALVLSVARQSRDSTGTFSEKFESRLAAMAAAHNLAFAPGADLSLHNMIEQQLNALAPNANTHYTLSGDNPELDRVAFQLMALVTHELVTNSIKYGALGTMRGDLTITTEMSEGCHLCWRETVDLSQMKQNAPGFGAELLTNAIAYELQGKARFEITPTGAHVDIWLPGTTLAKANAKVLPEPPIAAFDHASLAAPAGAAPDRILIVEDSFVVSLQLEDLLNSLGARDVVSFANGIDVLKRLDTWRPDLACLDIKIGENARLGLEVAEKLQDAQVPLIFITGYGSEFQLPTRFRDCPRLTKPISDVDLSNALNKIFGTS